MEIINGAGASCVVPSQPVNDETALKRTVGNYCCGVWAKCKFIFEEATADNIRGCLFFQIHI